MNAYLHVQFLNTITLKKTLAIICVCSNIVIEKITTKLPLVEDPRDIKTEEEEEEETLTM